MFHIRRRRRGLSSIVGGIIITSLAVLILGTLFVVGLQSTRSVQEANILANKIQTEIKLTTVTASENITGNAKYLTLKNTGPVRALLKWLIINVNGSKIALDLYGFVKNPSALNNLGIYLVSYYKLSNVSIQNNDGVLILEPGGYITLKMPYNLVPKEVITAEGKIINIEYQALLPNATVAQTATSVVVWPINLATLVSGILTNASSSGSVLSVNASEIQQPTQNSLGTGMMRYNHYLVLAYDLKDVTIKLSGQFNGARGFWYGDALIGLDPTWTRVRSGPATYTIGLTTFMPGCYQCNILTVTFANGTQKVFHMDYDFSDGWRMVILGFVPSSSTDLELRYSNPKYGINADLTGINALGIWWDYGERENYEDGGQAWIYANGTAKEVLIYKAVPGAFVEFSYRPFFYTMDVDNDGIPEFIFSTEDAGPGWAGTCNDYALRAGSMWPLRSSLLMDDWSVKPFWINITGSAYQIPGLKYAMVTVAIRVYFHDNLGDDVNEVDYANRTIFGIYLISSSGKIVSAREYDYQELAALEDTYPPNRNFFVMNVPLIVPDLNDTYHIGIMFQDPYDDCYHTYYNAGLQGYDDGDFTVAIEWLGLTFYARP